MKVIVVIVHMTVTITSESHSSDSATIESAQDCDYQDSGHDSELAKQERVDIHVIVHM